MCCCFAAVCCFVNDCSWQLRFDKKEKSCIKRIHQWLKNSVQQEQLFLFTVH